MPNSNRSVRYKVPESQGGGIAFTSRKSAERSVKRGLAVWEENTRTREMLLIYVVTDHRVISAERTACHPRFSNGDGFASLKAIAGLPCVQPQKLLTGKRPASPPRDYPVVEISRKSHSVEDCSIWISGGPASAA